MDPYIVNPDISVVYDMKSTSKQYIMLPIPSVSLQTGRGFLRYVQSLHQYQRDQELKSVSTEFFKVIK